MICHVQSEVIFHLREHDFAYDCITWNFNHVTRVDEPNIAKVQYVAALINFFPCQKKKFFFYQQRKGMVKRKNHFYIWAIILEIFTYCAQ